jgi:hypothetical protein
LARRIEQADKALKTFHSIFFLLPCISRPGFGLALLACFYISAQGIEAAESPCQAKFEHVAPGLDYAHLLSTNEPWSVHVARLERSRREFDILTTLGKGTIQGLETLAGQVKAMPSELGNPMAAVNGDFFVIKAGPYQGDPEGLQILNGELISAPGKLSFWIEPRRLHIEPISSAMKVTFPDGRTAPMGLNETPRTNGLVLFTPIFGSTTHATNFIELILEKSSGSAWLPLHADQNYRARVRSINGCGDSPIGPDRMVLTLGPRWTNTLSSADVGAVLTFSTALSKNLSKASTAIGGGPLLVHNSKAQKWPTEKGTNTYLLPRHPRTAIGYNSRYFFLVEVDGRQKGLSMGMSFGELANFMKDLGCSEAMNLDGGGSSTFWLNGKVMNSPSDKHERALANALVISRKPEQRKGEPHRN